MIKLFAEKSRTLLQVLSCKRKNVMKWSDLFKSQKSESHEIHDYLNYLSNGQCLRNKTILRN